MSDKLSTRLHCEVDINLKLSINFSLYITNLLLSSFFLIGTEKVISVFSSVISVFISVISVISVFSEKVISVFSSKHSSWSLNYFAS